MNSRNLSIALSLLAGTLSAQTPNTLTPLELSQGFQLLFTGTLQSVRDNWVTYQKDGTNITTLPANIQVATNGEYFVDMGSTQDIRSKTSYDDFEFRFDYRISDNAGLFYRLALLTAAPYENSIEYPLYNGTPVAGNWNAPGAAYDIYQPSVVNYLSFASGSWNTGVIRLYRDSVYHWHNGVQVVQFSLASADFRTRLDARKWANVPCVAMEAATEAQCSHSNPYRRAGHLGFQTGYPGNLYLRNLRVARYPFTVTGIPGNKPFRAAPSLNWIGRNGFAVQADAGVSYSFEITDIRGTVLESFSGTGSQLFTGKSTPSEGMYFVRQVGSGKHPIVKLVIP